MKQPRLGAEKFKAQVFSLLLSSWGIIGFALISKYLKNSKTGYSLFELMSIDKVKEIYNNLIYYRDNIAPYAIKTALSHIFVAFILSVSCVNLFFCLHFSYPKFFKAASNFVLPFFVYFFSTFFKHSRYTTCFLVVLSIAFSLFGLFRTFFTHDEETYVLCTKFLDELSGHKLSFFSTLIIQYAIVIIDFFLIRITDIRFSNWLMPFVSSVYIIGFVYISGYSTRFKLTLYFAIEKIEGIPPKSLYDVVFTFFTSRSYAFVKPFSMIMSFCDTVYRIIFLIPSEQVTYFENRRTSAFISAIYRRSFVRQKFILKDPEWHGSIRNKMRGSHLMLDMFPSLMLGWIILYLAFDILNSHLIRLPEITVIYLSHFIIIAEAFNSFIFVEHYKKFKDEQNSQKLSQELLEGE